MGMSCVISGSDLSESYAAGDIDYIRGVRKRIIVVARGPFLFPMINPVITKKSGEYRTEESCLSLEGVRRCTRYREIEVDYLDRDFKPQHGKYKDFIAQIIQHEIDHFEGILI